MNKKQSVIVCAAVILIVVSCLKPLRISTDSPFLAKRVYKVDYARLAFKIIPVLIISGIIFYRLRK